MPQDVYKRQGSMRAEDLGRYAGNYGEGGLRRLLDGGTVFTDSRYDYQQTTTPVSLATLTTGAMPSTHGVIGARWRDYVENDAVELIAGRKGPGPYNPVSYTHLDQHRGKIPGLRHPAEKKRDGIRFFTYSMQYQAISPFIKRKRTEKRQR